MTKNAIFDAKIKNIKKVRIQPKYDRNMTECHIRRIEIHNYDLG